MGCSEADRYQLTSVAAPWEPDDEAAAVPETVPFPAPSVVSATDIQSAAPLLDDERRQGLNLLAFRVFLNSVVSIWRPSRVPQKRRFGRLVCINC